MLNFRYEDFLSYLEGKKILITTHDLVDIDGLASCFALKFFLTEYFNKPTISISFSELSKPTRNYMVKFSEKFPEFKFIYRNNVKLSNYDVFLLVDANELNQIRLSIETNALQLTIPYIIIDHHHFNKDNLKNENVEFLNLINDSFSSTAEIILNLFQQYSQKLPTPYKYLIATAILTDSGFFNYGNNDTIKNISTLLDKDLDIQDIRLLLNREIDVSERIAQIKGLQRVEIIREGNYLIGVSNVSSFGAKVASTLLKIGFDVSIIHSIEKEQKIINGRVKKAICIKTGLHIGKIFEEISQNFGGSGGGHDGAAALTVDMELDMILKKIIEKIKEVLRSKF
ncbi:MAG: DHH family phosphoesterase [Promethearchaeota archaeon]|jgi:nanoRNase/pAp phosphatase (c-di-AMP/oligoRNAs hydrolase)